MRERARTAVETVAAAPAAFNPPISRGRMSGLAPELVTSHVLPEGSERPAPGAWRRGLVISAGGRCIHQLVEDQAARTPRAVAVVSGDASFSSR